jgi:2-phospho-L-lactate guanylyltransferase (CobY/MobA/RfbA family)
MLSVNSRHDFALNMLQQIVSELQEAQLSKGAVIRGSKVIDDRNLADRLNDTCRMVLSFILTSFALYSMILDILTMDELLH